MGKIKSYIDHFLKDVEKNDFPDNDDSKYIRKHDQEENIKSTVPEDENIHFPSYWAFEVFPPSYIDNLKDGLLKIGLVDELRKSNRKDLIEHLNLLRSLGSGYSWIPLGMIVPVDSSIYPALKHKFPEGIKEVRLFLNQFGSSTTVLSCQFQIDSQYAEGLKRPFNTFHSSISEKFPWGKKFHGPTQQKSDELNLELESIKSVGTEWIKTWFPGLYASKLIERNHPTVELFLFEGSKPIGQKNNEYDSYQWMFGFKSRYHTYTSEKLKSFYMTLDENRSTRSNMIIAAKMESAVEEDSLEIYSGHENLEKIAFMFHEFHKTFSYWVLFDLASIYDKKVKFLRDKLASIRLDNIEEALPVLEDLEKELSLLQINAIPFGHEMYSFEFNNKFYWDVFEFEPLENDEGKRKSFFSVRESWLKNMVISLLDEVKQTDQASERISSQINSRINLNLAVTNNRLQTWVVMFTVVTVIIGLFSFFGITYSSVVELLKSFL